MAPKRETALDSWCKELAEAIKNAGMTNRALADAIHVVPSTVSQWVSGKRTPELALIRTCDEALGTSGYLARYYERWVLQDLPPEWKDRWVAAEGHANLLQNYELSVIPGLLQTMDYAAAVMRVARHSPLDVEERVRRRIARQAVLSDDNPPMCIFVIDEYALRRPVGGPDVMVAQLAHLLDLASWPNIVVKVIPLGTEYYTALPFMLAEMDGAKIASVDNTLTGRVIERNDEVSEITKTWEDIREAALSPKESVTLIEEVITEWQTQTSTGASRPAAAATATSA